jgi:hypothetical protein
MKKIITTLTALTFALGVAAAAQAQEVKTPEKPAVQSTQATPQVSPQEAVKTGDATKEVAKSKDQVKAKKEAKKGKHAKKTTAPLTKTQEGTK